MNNLESQWGKFNVFSCLKDACWDQVLFEEAQLCNCTFSFPLLIPRLLPSPLGCGDVPRGSQWQRAPAGLGAVQSWGGAATLPQPSCRGLRRGETDPHHRELAEKLQSTKCSCYTEKSHFTWGKRASGLHVRGSVGAQTLLLAHQPCASLLIWRKLLPF